MMIDVSIPFKLKSLYLHDKTDVYLASKVD